MTPRTPTLDRTWMEALGFVLQDDPGRRVPQWRNPSLKLYIDDDESVANVATRYTTALRCHTERMQQFALRDILLPAMGLTVTEEYRDGYVKRSYVAPE